MQADLLAVQADLLAVPADLLSFAPGQPGGGISESTEEKKEEKRLQASNTQDFIPDLCFSSSDCISGHVTEVGRENSRHRCSHTTSHVVTDASDAEQLQTSYSMPSSVTATPSSMAEKQGWISSLIYLFIYFPSLDCKSGHMAENLQTLLVTDASDAEHQTKYYTASS